MMRWTAKERALAYEQLQAIHTGFERVRLALGNLKGLPGLDRTELGVFSEFADEARATTLSYLTEAIESTETEYAGRLFRRRQIRDRKNESLSR
jgi:hypothetical protein